jgi:hypothetical protein
MGKIRRWSINIFTWAPEGYSGLKFFIKKALEYGEHFDFVSNYAKVYAEFEEMIEHLPEIPQWFALPALALGLLFILLTNRRSAKISNTSSSKENNRVNARKYDIAIGNGAPFESIEPVGVNRNRQIRVNIKNNTDIVIVDGRLHIIGLDPPKRLFNDPNGVAFIDFLLRDNITVPANGNVFINVAYRWEGSSQAEPSPFIGINIQPSGTFFNQADFGKLPMASHKFHLRFSSVVETYCEIYCRLFINSNGTLRLEEWDNSTKPSLNEDAVDDRARTIIEWKKPMQAVNCFADEVLVEKEKKLQDDLMKYFDVLCVSKNRISELEKDMAASEVPVGEQVTQELEIERRRQKAADLGDRLAEDNIREAWASLRTDIVNKLERGNLIAKGIPSPYAAGKSEVAITPHEWRLLMIDPPNETAVEKSSGKVVFVGIVLGKPS